MGQENQLTILLLILKLKDTIMMKQQQIILQFCRLMRSRQQQDLNLMKIKI